MISTSNGWRFLKSVDCGSRPNSSEISLPLPPNFPFGDNHETSSIFFVFTLRMNANLPPQPDFGKKMLWK